MNFYDFQTKTSSGTPLSMDEYKGRVVLIVNTATECALTPQFEGLEKLHLDYGNTGLTVLGFPCNQFRNQEPLSNDEMAEACKVNHGVTFQLTEKVDVNGKNADPLFKFLKSKLGGILGSSIKWNFTKFLIDRNGEPVKRYAPTTKPEKIRVDIESLLRA